MKAKKLVKKLALRHQAQYSDLRKVGKLVRRYRKALEKTKKAVNKIVRTFDPFRQHWARAFSAYLDDDVRAGESTYDEIVLQALSMFKSSEGRNFNAYLVSCLLNRVKNLRNAKKASLSGKLVRVGVDYRPRRRQMP